METYWTFERDGEIQDHEFDTEKECQCWADEAFAEQCQEESPRNGEEFSEDITLIHFSIDDDGEMKEIQRIEGSVDYEHYHGDLKEHGYP